MSRFITLAHELGFLVLVRAGPYICAGGCASPVAPRSLGPPSLRWAPGLHANVELRAWSSLKGHVTHGL